MAPSASAQSDAILFRSKECELLLEWPSEFHEDSERQATEIEDWIMLRHPILKRAMARARSVERKFDLLFMASGYHLPPVQSSLVGHYKRVGRNDFGVNKIHRSNLRHAANLILEPDPEIKGDSSRFLAVLMTHSLFLLETLVKDRASSPSQRPVFYRSKRVGTDDLKFHFDAWSSFTPGEVDGIAAMLAWTNPYEVRAALVARVFKNKKAIVKLHRDAFELLDACSTPEQFDNGFAQLSPVHTRQPTVREVPQKSDEVQNFIVTRPSTSGPIEQFSFASLHRDVHESSQLLTRGLLRFQRLRARELDLSFSRGPNGLTLEDFESFHDRLVNAKAHAFDVLRGLEDLEKVFVDLAEWTERTGEFVAALDGRSDELAKLSASEADGLQAIVEMMPAQRELMERAVVSGREHRRSVLARLATFARIEMILGAALERSVAGRSSTSHLLTGPEAAQLETILGKITTGGTGAE